MDNILTELGVVHKEETSVQQNVYEDYLQKELDTAVKQSDIEVTDSNSDSNVSSKKATSSIFPASTEAVSQENKNNRPRLHHRLVLDLVYNYSSSSAEPVPNKNILQDRYKRHLITTGSSRKTVSAYHALNLYEGTSAAACYDNRTAVKLNSEERLNSFQSLMREARVSVQRQQGIEVIQAQSNENIRNEEGKVAQIAGNSKLQEPIDTIQIICPICDRELDPSGWITNSEALDELTAANILDQHIERCTRRKSRSSSSSTSQDGLDNYDRNQTNSTRQPELGIPNNDKSIEFNKLEQVEAQLDKKKDQKKKRSRYGPNQSVVTECSEYELADSENDSNDDNHSSVRKRLRKHRGVSSKKGSTVELDTSSTDGNNSVHNDKGLQETCSIVDDWEDDKYNQRLSSLSAENNREQRRSRHRSSNSNAQLDDSLINNGSSSDIVVATVSGLSLVDTEDGCFVSAQRWKELHQYQRDGVHWLHSLYENGVGGILGDEMGLGKTAQVCVHLGSLAALHLRSRYLRQQDHRSSIDDNQNSAIFVVACPATVLHHWLQEAHRWAPLLRTVVLHSISLTGKEVLQLGDNGISMVLRKLRRKSNTQGLLVLTTYEGLKKHRHALMNIDWTAVCLDEGQKIRNSSTEISAVCKMIPAFHRLLLSGTPIQNSLMELWSLFDFIYPGRLGSMTVFEQEFANPIRLGGYRNASKLQYEIGVRCATALQEIVRPFLLRRKKDDLTSTTHLPPKIEQVLFCQISPRQREAYLNVVASPEVQDVLNRRIPAFRAISTLRKVCNHPALVFKSLQGIRQLKDKKNADKTSPLISNKDVKSKINCASLEEDELDDDIEDREFLALLQKGRCGDIEWADSGKLLVLSKVLPLWYQERHKVLIFCQTRAMLTLIELMVKELFSVSQNVSRSKSSLAPIYLRLDGNTPISQRAGLINRFNSNSSIFLMLLTTRTGGVGINLTGANRVVLFDPDWNPMTDMQARERAWRLGQQRAVTIYRLITRGTIEEKIYKRQIFKLLLSNRILSDPKQKALFSQSQMHELFELNDQSNESNQLSVEFGYSDVGELPKGGEVNMKIDENSTAKSRNESRKCTQDNSLTDFPVSEFSAADIIQEPLSEDFYGAATSDIALCADDGKDKTEDKESSERDRRLLRALFEGEAITSIYDHHYVDPTNNVSSTNSSHRQNASAKAGKMVNQALRQLEASATMYRASAGNSISKPTTSNPSSHDSINTVHADAESSTAKRFGSQSASGASSMSSSNLLAGIKAAGKAPNVTRADFSQASPSLRREGHSQQQIARRTVRDDIRERLLALFRGNTGSSSNSSRVLSTSFILSRFQDLGDQYAPLFRDLLREVAQPAGNAVSTTNRRGWVLKERNLIDRNNF